MPAFIIVGSTIMPGDPALVAVQRPLERIEVV
jgi:hypothetical protein